MDSEINSKYLTGDLKIITYLLPDGPPKFSEGINEEAIYQVINLGLHKVIKNPSINQINLLEKYNALQPEWRTKSNNKSLMKTLEAIK